MEHQIEVCHVSIGIHADFDIFTQKFESLLGQFDRSLLKETDPKVIEKRLKEIHGEEDLILFDVFHRESATNPIIYFFPFP